MQAERKRRKEERERKLNKRQCVVGRVRGQVKALRLSLGVVNLSFCHSIIEKPNVFCFCFSLVVVLFMLFALSHSLSLSLFHNFFSLTHRHPQFAPSRANFKACQDGANERAAWLKPQVLQPEMVCRRIAQGWLGHCQLWAVLNTHFTRQCLSALYWQCSVSANSGNRISNFKAAALAAAQESAQVKQCRQRRKRRRRGRRWTARALIESIDSRLESLSQKGSRQQRESLKEW